MIPRIMIAGTHSGVGKTSVTLGLIAALKRRGLRVQTFKVGPDFLDPSYHTVASGRPAYNLDSWMSNQEYVTRLFSRVSVDADVSIIEGVMGLFDGAYPDSIAGSSAEIALWLNSPVILVADVYGMAGSIAALVKGFATFYEGVHIDGVIANACGSRRHAELVGRSLEYSGVSRLVGAIEKDGLPALSSRHLGLVTANAKNLSPLFLDAMAGAVERQVSLDDILRIADSAGLFSLGNNQGINPSHGKTIRIGVARDDAFHFYYQDLFDELTKRGCTMIPFSPLVEAKLPAGIDALYIGGGYPEEYAEILAVNEAMKEDIRKFARSGRPVYAECGGLMYLSEGIETRDNISYPMVGLVPARTRMLDRIKSLGYVEVALREDSLWGEKGDLLRGHEFHYSELLVTPVGKEGWRSIYDMTYRRTNEVYQEGFQKGNILASYIHLHLASRPASLEAFLALCRKYR
ncbi:MAG: cobyrinate a,c-diamide synthase [Syntrophales bacterium]|jgi:cobyrinic acid a,c-diamide synthase|nr:cobyrinate a,c-diamide synthase [Syntrophales bacterium]MCK9391221.1 cobyrinate a,c-diamide synthase [Syntrophales bacterium]